MTSKTIVILGGGVGGIVAANELRARLPREHRLLLVERNSEHSFAASYLWVMTGDRRPKQITRELRTLLSPGVELIQEEVKRIDVTARRVEMDARTLDFDYLVVALGAELAPETVPGFGTFAHTFYDLAGSIRLHEALRSFSGGRVAVVVAGTPYKCPGAPHEGAMLIADFLRSHSGNPSEVHLFTPEPQPLPVAGPQLGDMVRQVLAQRGVTFHPSHKLSAVGSARNEAIFEDQSVFAYDLLVIVPPHRAPAVVRESGMVDESGWIPVDRLSLKTRDENVYAIGDVTRIVMPGRWKPDVPLTLPKAGVFAHTQAKTVARQIASAISGRSSSDAFCGQGYCMLEVGAGSAGFAFGDFFAEPSPKITLKPTGKSWHLGKILFEKWWLASPGVKRQLLRTLIQAGAKTYGIPAEL